MNNLLEPKMSRVFQMLLAAGCGVLLLATPLRAQVGNDNPTGISGVYNGNVTTAGSYDPYTGNATRSVTDITVAGAVGAYPLAFTRTMNSRYNPGVGLEFGPSGSWRHSYQWSIESHDYTSSGPNRWSYLPNVYTVNYPDGRRLSFYQANNDTRFRAGSGISDRFQQLTNVNGGTVYLLLPDGGQIAFQATVDRQEISEVTHLTESSFTYELVGIIDPYGQTTTVTYGGSTTTIQEPAGRTLTLYYISTPWNGDTVLDSVVASDGRSVKYNYGGSTAANGTPYTYLGNVQYLDTSGASYTQAIYAYQQSNTDENGRPLIQWAIDPMYAGPMWAIGYIFVPASSGGVYGQLQSENYLDPATGTLGAPVSSLAVNDATRTETRGDGPSRTFTYNGGRLISYTDFKGQSASLSYDADGYVTATSDQRQNQTDRSNQALTGRPTQVIHPLTPPDTVRASVQYEYGSATCPDPNNRDGNNPYYLYRVTNETGYSTIYLRDANKRVVQINYADGTYETFSYNGFGQVQSHQMTSGGTETFRCDEGLASARGLLTSYVPPATPSDLHPENNPTAYHYDGLDRVDSITDSRGKTTSFQYNTRGQLTRATHLVDNSYVEIGYDNHGDRTSVKDELGHTTNYIYDDYKRLLAVTNPLNQTMTYNYALDWSHPYAHTTKSLKYVLSPLQKNVVFDYDENLRKKYQTVAANTDDIATTFCDYDEVGNLTYVRDPRWYVTTYGYDQRNREIWMDDPIASDRSPTTGHTMNWEYDGVGNKLKETRADDAFRSWDYDIPNRVTHAADWRMSLSDPPITMTYTRNTTDTSEHIIDAKGADYTFEFDALHRKTSETYPLDASGAARTETWHYDPAGNVDQHVDVAGNTNTVEYDNRNRPRQSSWTSNGPITVTNYDSASRITDIATNNGETVVAFGYDDANRQIWEDQTLAGYPTRRVETPRDADGSRTQLNVLGGDYTLNYDYNQRNELFHLRGDDPFATFTRDVAGNVTQLKLDWALGSPSNYTYDELNRVATIDHGNATAIFQHNHYQYDNVGRQVAAWRDEDGKGERFWYSATNQITDARYGANQVWTGSPTNAAKTQTYTYSADNLNRQSMTENGAPTNYVTNAMNQMTALNGQTIGYDGNFNFASIGGWHFEYDAENRLTSLENSGPRAAFVFDGLGRCVKRTIEGVTTLITYDAWNPILEWDQGGIRKAVNVYGAKADEILVRVDAVYGPMSYKRDRQGNITFVLGGDTQIIEQYTYDAFGKPTIMNGSGVVNTNSHAVSAVGNRFMFQGREYFGELGLMDFRHRFYAPSLGRFLQKDPLGFGGGDMNLFRYCGNDPINRRDPFGLESPVPTKKKDGNDYGAPAVSIDGVALDPGDADHDSNVGVSGSDNNGSTGTVDVHSGPTGSGRSGNTGVPGGLDNSATGVTARSGGQGNRGDGGGGGATGSRNGSPSAPSGRFIDNPYRDSGPYIAHIFKDFDGQGMNQLADVFTYGIAYPAAGAVAIWAAPVLPAFAIDATPAAWEGLIRSAPYWWAAFKTMDEMSDPAAADLPPPPPSIVEPMPPRIGRPAVPWPTPFPRW